MHRWSRIVGIALLLGAVALGWATSTWHTFVDEGGNVLFGYLLSRGALLYRDVFTHHFPFPYYWVAGVTGILGRSMSALRLSVLVFELLCLGAVLRTTRLWLATGLFALAWSAIAYLYFGNLVLYDVFKGFPLLGVFAATLACTAGSARLRPSDGVLLGVLASIAGLCDPYSIYPVALAAGALAASADGRRAVRSMLATGLVAVAAYTGLLLASGTLGDFWRTAIEYNWTTYLPYASDSAFPVGRILTKLARGLDLLDERWWLRWTPRETIDWPNQAPDHWMLTGFLYRAAVIVLVVRLGAGGRWLAAGFVYLWCALLMATRGEVRFHGIPFVLDALFAAACTVTGELPRARRDAREVFAPLGARHPSRTSAAALALRATRITLAAMLAWLVLSCTAVIWHSREQLSYEATFGPYERQAALIRRLACERSDVLFAYYPWDALLNFFADLRPVSRWGYLFPWVAREALPEVVHTLGERDAVVSIDLEGEVWGQQNRVWLAPLIAFLDERYRYVGAGFWVSPRLYAECGPSATLPDSAMWRR